jgi:chromosome segregation ATPase
MADNKTRELRRRRSELSESLPELSRQRDQTFRLNSDALALDRAGVTDHTPEELARLGEGQAGADAAIRAVQREIRDLDAEITSTSRGRLGARVGRGLRRRGRS